MAAREVFRFKSTRLIEAIAPTDVITDNALDNTGDGATCIFKVYDPGKNQELSAAEATGQSVLSVNDASVFVVADTVEILLDDATLHFTSIATGGIDTVSIPNTITVADVLPSAAAKGNAVRKLFSPAISMTEFGTPDTITRDWGFRGALPSNHASQIEDQEIDVEITFLGTGSPAGGLDVFEVICAVIKKECTDAS